MVLHDFEDDLYLDPKEDPNVKVGHLESIAASLEQPNASVILKIVRASKLTGLAHAYDELCLQAKAKLALKKADELLLDHNGNPHAYLQWVQRASAVKIAATSPVEMDVNKLMEIAQICAERGFQKIELMALFMIDSALIGKDWVQNYNQELPVKVRERTEKLLSDLGSMQYLHDMGLGYHSLFLGAAEESLDWWERFDNKYPDYHAWKPRIARQLQLQTLHVNQKEFIQSLRDKQRAEEIRQECGDFWGEDDAPQSLHHLSISDNQIQSTLPERMPAKKSEVLQKYFFEDWNHDMTITDPDTGRQYFGTLGSGSVVAFRHGPFKTLLKWMLLDLKAGLLLPADLCSIFGQDLEQFPVQQCELLLQSFDPQHLLTTLYGTLESPVSCEKWKIAFEMLRSWLRRTHSFPKSQQLYMMIELQRTRIERQPPPSQLKEECRRALDLINDINLEEVLMNIKGSIDTFKHQCQLSFAQAVGTSWIRERTWTSDMERDFLDAIALLESAISDAKPPAHGTRPWSLIATNDFFQGCFYYQLGQLRVKKFACGAPIEIGTAMRDFRLAELCFQVRRKSFGSKKGFKAIEGYLKVLEDPMVRRIFPSVLQMLTSLPLTAPFHNNSVWEWVQSAKSRGLASLGWFSGLNEQYDRAFLGVEDEAEKEFGLNQLSILSSAADKTVLFIDYYTDFYNGEIGTPIMVTYRSGFEAPQIFKFSADNVDVQDLGLYKSHFLSALERHQANEESESLQPSYWLQKFVPLIRPLLPLTKKGDYLVISACGILHGVPLHAILLDDSKPLINRNPVTYTTSQRALWYAALSRLSLSGPSAPNPPFLSSIFNGAPTPSGRASAVKVFQQLNPNGKNANSLRTGDSFTKMNFTAALNSNLNLIHYHAHATTQPDDPLSQSLEFNDGPLSVREYLDITPVSKGAHITLLGCSSGVTVNTISNEPLGLVPALMFHGASSVVSALWPIDDGDAVLFAHEFYADFVSRGTKYGQGGKQHRDEHGREPAGADTEAPSDEDGVDKAAGNTGMKAEVKNEATHPCNHAIDLARATQRAILRIYGEDPADLRRWAGFTLNGWWIMHVPL